MASNGSASRPELAGLELPDAGLVAGIVRLHMLAARVIDDITSAAGVTPADYLVLGTLRRSPDGRSSPTRLAEILWRSTGGMTLTLDRLVAAGWVVRQPDPDDRRRIVVALTPAGRELAVRVNDALHAWEDGLDLSDDRRAETARLVDDLLGVLADAAPRA
jgi:DNA-binding MarR family transcriptional regulator